MPGKCYDDKIPSTVLSGSLSGAPLPMKELQFCEADNGLLALDLLMTSMCIKQDPIQCEHYVFDPQQGQACVGLDSDMYNISGIKCNSHDASDQVCVMDTLMMKQQSLTLCLICHSTHPYLTGKDAGI